jgi:hypothetical protein
MLHYFLKIIFFNIPFYIILLNLLPFKKIFTYLSINVLLSKSTREVWEMSSHLILSEGKTLTYTF